MPKPKLLPNPTSAIRQTNMRVDPEVMNQLLLFCAAHPLRPRRDSVIEIAIVEYMQREQVKLEPERAKRAAILQAEFSTPVASP